MLAGAGRRKSDNRPVVIDAVYGSPNLQFFVGVTSYRDRVRPEAYQHEHVAVDPTEHPAALMSSGPSPLRESPILLLYFAPQGALSSA